MPGKTIKWISEEETVKRLSLLNARTLRRLIKSQRWIITYTQVNRNAKRQYNEEDVEKILLEHSNLLTPIVKK